ncbi:MAG TPA: DUF433 domain-containing protein [bacterium]|nr:DUF433 domain-containing protein [bacterium]
MKDDEIKYLGVGIYTVSEVSRLTGIPTQRVRRWMAGYHFKYHNEIHSSDSLWQLPIQKGSNDLILTFLDMIELRFVEKLRNETGMSLQFIRQVYQRAMTDYQFSHPFSTLRFKTDGQAIFIEELESSGERRLLDLFRREYAFHEILKPILKDLDYDDKVTTHWWPYTDKRVVIDPTRCFGKPIVTDEGIKTSTLYDSYLAEEKSVSVVSKWYEVSISSVEAAIDFEESLNRKLAA